MRPSQVRRIPSNIRTILIIRSGFSYTCSSIDSHTKENVLGHSLEVLDQSRLAQLEVYCILNVLALPDLDNTALLWIPQQADILHSCTGRSYGPVQLGLRRNEHFKVVYVQGVSHLIIIIVVVVVVVIG